MSTAVQRRRGTTAQHAGFAGLNGELTVDTDKDVVVVHDGTTTGGHPMLKQDGTNSALALGSAATPSLKFTGDPNTGLYSPGADQLAISTNGTVRLFVDASGRVLAGTGTSPTAGNGQYAPLVIQGYIGSSTGESYLSLQRGQSASSITAGNPLGGIAFGDNAGRTFAQISAFADANADLTDLPGRIAFYTCSDGSNSIIERMRLDSSGRLGLGTSSPEQKFEIAQSGTFSRSLVFQTSAGNDCFITAKATGASVSLDTNLNIRADGANVHGGIIFSRGLNRTYTESMRIDSSGRVGIGDNLPDSTLTIKAATSVVPLRVSGPSSEFARIDTSGRLLVGTSTSTNNLRFNQKLAVVQAGTDTVSGISVVSYSGASSQDAPSIVDLCRSRGSSDGSMTAVGNGDSLGEINFRGADGTGFITGATIKAFTDGGISANDLPTRLVFSTTADGASSPTERLRITNAGVLQVADAGNISVGTTTGTKIGTATTQKLGFYNATPVVQPTAVADATDAATAISQLNALLAHMRTLGLIAT
jgi:hypothetical protein